MSIEQPKKDTPIVGHLIQKLAARIGATVFMEPEWGIVGQITFKSGRRSYFKYNTLGLNPTSSSELSKDKDYANFFMESMGYPVVPGTKTFFSKEWGMQVGAPERNIDAAYAYARGLGLPVIVKPNSGKQGAGVYLAHTKREFYKALNAIFKIDRVALVQRMVQGKDYRVFVFENRVVCAYERVPLNVVGNGKSTIQELLTAKQKTFSAASRDLQIFINDPRIVMKLKRQGLRVDSVPKKGAQIFLLDNANLSTGGDARDASDTIHPEFKKLAIKLTKDMGLRLCGVDLMVDGDISAKPDQYWILEINASPGLDHYAKLGKAQEKVVEDLYVDVLKHLDSEV